MRAATTADGQMAKCCMRRLPMVLKVFVPVSFTIGQPRPIGKTMPDIAFIRAEIERMCAQVQRPRGEIRQLQRSGIPTSSAEALLDRMLDKIDILCAERDRLRKQEPGHNRGKGKLHQAVRSCPARLSWRRHRSSCRRSPLPPMVARRVRADNCPPRFETVPGRWHLPSYERNALHARFDPAGNWRATFCEPVFT
jgi:hypothetical protein